jgi:hypothetical protein
VQDSPDQLIDEPSFANKLYPLNQYGNEGGYKQVPDPVGNLNTKSNEGEYGYQDAHIVDEGYAATQLWRPLNAYAAYNNLDAADAINTLEILQVNKGRTPNGQPYPNFNPSSYSPVSILLTQDPLGSNGLLSSDSFIARLGAQTLRKDFENRIGRQITKQTIARANIFNVNSGTDILNLVTGRVPLIEPDYTITSPSNPLIAATDFALRLAGSTIPTSTIPGSYFDTTINPGFPTTIQQLTAAFPQAAATSGTGNFFSRLLGQNKTGSQLFLNNTGGGQKSRLFGNIDYNKYKPGYERTLFDRVAGVVVGSTTNNSNYYVGSVTSEPSFVFSPSKALPIDQFSREVQSPVYGPQELAQLYEGPSQDVRLGANGPIYSDGGGVEGGFTWVSPKYKGNAGKKVGIGGLITNQDQDFRPSSYNSTESTNREFRGGSILDNTQRLINSQPTGGKRLQHVGNAIDQVSKVFNDGYKELTKGSRVLTYVGAIGQEVGSEYCRVFAKDVPYLQYNDLQKVDGITKNGRRFAYSVLDNTYNLNIVPNKQEGGQDSTNLVSDRSSGLGYAKKYMFSLENLAWRTSNSAGYSVSDLAVCERGPNGGRVMWFPPYGLTFSETVSAAWKPTDFIGRPEPIYTYSNTQRTGSLTWKIVVDHPSVLNIIVNKVLSNETNKNRIDSILESFFAGCRKYDLYELAKKYYTIKPNDLYELQQLITSKEVTKEQLQYSISEVQSGDKSPGDGVNQPISPEQLAAPFQKYLQYGWYFDNDVPTPAVNYQTTYDSYTSSSNKANYQSNAPTTTTGNPYVSNPSMVQQFFNDVVEYNFTFLKQLADDLIKYFGQRPKDVITVVLVGTTSAPASVSYNLKLAARRIESITSWLSSYDVVLQRAIASQNLKLTPDPKGEETNVSTKGKGGIGNSYNCSSNTVKDSLSKSEKIYTVYSMACRRTAVSNITIKNNTIEPQPQGQPTQQVTTGNLQGTLVPVTTTEQTVQDVYVPKDNITKRVLRALLSECDYFETVKTETPMVYDNLREKLKFFQPAFHSTTPEGLNTRLTFLQQCMRPGDTIPTVKTGANGNQTLQYNNATNTSFGAPPVLILRIGDFYNTKIIPDSMNITYEQLDINPEGIGVQPMIANVTLGFKFVGGSGLKESVDKLQNALTFNYYANTEIYDDRADVTDESIKIIDADFLKSIGNPPPPTVNQTQNNSQQNNSNTIGNVLAKTGVGNNETGSIQYRSYMDKFVGEAQTYFQTVVNKSKDCLKQYNNAILQNWSLERNYIGGKILCDTSKNTTIFGKPTGIENRINKVFDDLIANIDSNNPVTQDLFIAYMTNNKNFSQQVIRQLKTNYKNFLTQKKGTYQNGITLITQQMTQEQQNLIGYLSDANVLLFNGSPTTGTDGLVQTANTAKIYDISGTTSVDKSSTGTTTYDELNDDIGVIQDNLIEFYDLCTDKNDFVYGSQTYDGILIYGDAGAGVGSTITTVEPQVFKPFSTSTEFTKQPFRRAYMLLSNDILVDKDYQTFKDAMIGNIVNNKTILSNGNPDVTAEFDNYWLGIAKVNFNEENNITSQFLDDMQNNKLKKFIKYTPFPSKERLFTYELFTSTKDKQDLQSKLLKSLNVTTQGTQQNTDLKNWNDLNGPEVYFSKTKLN